MLLRRTFLKIKAQNDNVPYIHKYKGQKDAQHTVQNLSKLYNTSMEKTSHALSALITAKWHKNIKLKIRDYDNELHLFLYTDQTYPLESVAEKNYESIIDRLNKLHAAFHVLEQIQNSQYEEKNNLIMIPLGISSYKREIREVEWDI